MGGRLPSQGQASQPRWVKSNVPFPPFRRFWEHKIYITIVFGAITHETWNLLLTSIAAVSPKLLLEQDKIKNLLSEVCFGSS